MVLDLDEEVVLAEDVLVHAGGGDGAVVVTHLTDVALFAGGVGGQQLRHVPPRHPLAATIPSEYSASSSASIRGL